MRTRLMALATALLVMLAGAVPVMATTQVFTVANFALPAAPPSYFVPNVNGWAVPAGHTNWQAIIDTTGLPDGQPLANLVVQHHYTNVQLGTTGLPNQGQVTNPDGSVTLVPGGLFTGWLDDCSAPLMTTFTSKTGALVHQAFLGCDFNLVKGAYPDHGRFLITSSPGYASVPSVTMRLN